MPISAQEYIASLPEFDANIFKRVTGIDVKKPEDTIDLDGCKVSKTTIKEALKFVAEHKD